MINKLFALILIAASHSTLAQKTLVKFDVSELSVESPLNLNELFIVKGHNIERIEIKNDTLVVEIDQLPNMIKIASLSGRRLVAHHAIWIDSTELKLTGIFGTDSFSISPENANQKHANKLLDFDKLNANEKLLLEESKPYLVHLYYKKSFMNLLELQEILDNLPKENLDFWAATKLKEYLNGISEIGYDSDIKKLTHMSGMDKSGEIKKFNLSEKKYSLIDFTSTSCAPCLLDIDELVRLYSIHKDRVDFISIWHDSNQETWISVAKRQKDKIEWTSLRDHSGAFFKTLNVSIFPTYMLFDQNGNLVKDWKGSSIKSIEKHLDHLK